MNTSNVSTILNKILFEKGIKPTELARRVNLPQPTIQRIAKGTSAKPHLNSLKLIANFFSITVDQLSGQVPISWLEPDSIQQLTKLGLTKVPVLVWQALSVQLKKAVDDRESDALSYIVANTAMSKETFALDIQDASMEPNFPISTMVLFDPTKAYKDRSYVLVKLAETGEYIFRQLVIDAEHLFLRALSPDLQAFPLRMLNDNDEICATMVQAILNFED